MTSSFTIVEEHLDSAERAEGFVCTSTGQPWQAAVFVNGPQALGIHTDRWEWVDHLVIVGLDQLGTDDEGRPILEFKLSDGRLLSARFDDGFLGSLLAALRDGAQSSDPTSAPEQPGAAQASTESPAPDSPALNSPAPSSPAPGAPAVAPLADVADPPPPPPGKSGTKAALAREVRELRAYLEQFGFEERAALRSTVESLSAHRAELRDDARRLTAELAAARAALVQTRSEEVLQKVGIYSARHRLEHAADYADQLERLRSQVAAMAVEPGGAVTATDDWVVNGSRDEGRRVIEDLCTLILRAYNAEAEHLVGSLRPSGLDAAIDRLTVSRETISRFGRSMKLEITESYHRLRLDELTLTADMIDRLERDRLRITESNADAGWLYVASNRGAFGDRVVRIGVAEHADPSDVAAELTTPDVPFSFDVHCVVAVERAAVEEAKVLADLADLRVNLTDPTCRYFAISPLEARAALERVGLDVVEFDGSAPAEHWQVTRNTRDGVE